MAGYSRLLREEKQDVIETCEFCGKDIVTKKIYQVFETLDTWASLSPFEERIIKSEKIKGGNRLKYHPKDYFSYFCCDVCLKKLNKLKNSLGKRKVKIEKELNTMNHSLRNIEYNVFLGIRHPDGDLDKNFFSNG